MPQFRALSYFRNLQYFIKLKILVVSTFLLAHGNNYIRNHFNTEHMLRNRGVTTSELGPKRPQILWKCADIFERRSRNFARCTLRNPSQIHSHWILELPAFFVLYFTKYHG